MDLREAVRDSHKRAEQTELSKLMITGGMRKDTYAAFIENMQVIYAELERDGMIAKPEVLRNKIILQDIADMDYEPCVIVPNVKNYVQYLSGLSTNDRWAHVYVHYLGNMYGGQMIGRQLPGPHAHLTFEDLKGCIAYVRENLIDIRHDEANCAFEWTITVYDELYHLFG
jgi:heme oxygenase